MSGHSEPTSPTSIDPTPQEQAEAAQQQAASELLAGKYKTTDDLVSGYKNAEAKIGEQAAKLKELQEALASATSKPSTEEPTSEPTSTEAAGVNPIEAAAAIASKVMQDGLSEVPQDMVGSTGLDPAVEEQLVQAKINELAANQKADLAGQQVWLQQATNEAGSLETLQALDAYIEATYEGAQKEAIEEACKNPTTGMFALRGLLAEAGLTQGTKRPQQGVIQGELTSQSAAGQGFASEDEHVAAIRDPRYRTDPQYRQGVMNKLAKSSWLSNRHVSGGVQI